MSHFHLSHPWCRNVILEKWHAGVGQHLTLQSCIGEKCWHLLPCT